MYEEEFLGKTLYIQEPCKRTVFHEILNKTKNRKQESYLSFPYVVFSHDGYSLHVALTLEKPTLESNIYFPCLGNIFDEDHFYSDDFHFYFSSFNVCLENCPNIDSPYECIDYFWNSYFLIYAYSKIHKELIQWQNYTRIGSFPDDFWKTPKQRAEFRKEKCFYAENLEDFIICSTIYSKDPEEVIKTPKLKKHFIFSNEK